MSDASENRVYLAESDPQAWAGANRRIQILMFVVLAVFYWIACLAWWTDSPQGERPWALLLIALWAFGLYGAGFLCFHLMGSAMRRDIWFGMDFIAVSTVGRNSGTTIIRYQDVACVTLHLSKDHLIGATIRGKWMTLVVAKWIRNPAIVVRSVFEHVPEHVTWRRSWRCFARLSREEVSALIREAHPPDIDHLLPAGTMWARAEDLFAGKKPDGKGLVSRLLARGPTREMTMMSLKTPTPASRYVGFTLLQMIETDATTRTFRRSEPLPVLTFREQKAEPPRLEDVLWHLKEQCGLALKRRSEPVEGTFRITLQDVPCKVWCRFDKSKDACCQIRLEKVQDMTGGSCYE